MSDPSASAELLRDRLARNEAVYRDVNEQIDALNSLGPRSRGFRSSVNARRKAAPRP